MHYYEYTLMNVFVICMFWAFTLYILFEVLYLIAQLCQTLNSQISLF